MRRLPWLLGLALLSYFAAPLALAEAAGPVYDAIDLMVKDLANDVGDAAGSLPSRVALTGLTLSDNLDHDVRAYVLAKVLSAGKGDTGFRFVACKECMTAHAETDGDQVFISKGINSHEQMQKTAALLGVSTYAEVNLTYTGSRLILLVNMFDVKAAEIKWSRSYTTRVLAVGRAGFRLSVDVGQMVGIAEKGYPAALSLYAAERIYGFGEFGLVAQGSMAQGDLKQDLQIGPMLRLNVNELSGRPWSWGALLWSFRATYGWYDGNQRDITLGTGPKLELGTIYHISLDILQGVALKSSDSSSTAPTTPSSGQTVTGTRSDQPKKQDHLPTSLLIGFGFDIG